MIILKPLSSFGQVRAIFFNNVLILIRAILIFTFLVELDKILAQGENNQDSALNSTNAYIKFVSNFQGILNKMI